jgi:hypothetical protein
MSDGKVRIIVCIIEGDADTVVDKLAEVIEGAIRRVALELPKPEPAPLSRPENFPAHLYSRRHRTTQR